MSDEYVAVGDSAGLGGSKRRVQEGLPHFLSETAPFAIRSLFITLQREDTRPLHGLDDPTVVSGRSGHRNAYTPAPD